MMFLSHKLWEGLAKTDILKYWPSSMANVVYWNGYLARGVEGCKERGLNG